MFLFRGVFRIIIGITIVLFLIPTDDTSNKSDAEALVKPQNISAMQAYDAARDTLSDLSGFCQRNANVCATSGAALDVLQRKAKYAVRRIYNWAQSDNTQNQAPQKPLPMADRKAASPGSKKSTSKPLRVSENVHIIHTGAIRKGRKHQAKSKRPSQNTLKIKDLIPAWNGPKTSARA